MGASPLFYCMLNPAGSREAVVARVEEIARRVAEPAGIEVVDVEFRGTGKRRVLRIYIDKPEGVTVGDCEFVSRNVSTILDVEDVVPGGSYTLEVSSPGVERPLKHPRDFERFIGRQIRVVLRHAIAGRQRWEGELASYADELITLKAASGELVQFTRDEVKRATLKFDW